MFLGGSRESLLGVSGKPHDRVVREEIDLVFCVISSSYICSGVGTLALFNMHTHHVT